MHVVVAMTITHKLVRYVSPENDPLSMALIKLDDRSLQSSSFDITSVAVHYLSTRTAVTCMQHATSSLRYKVKHRLSDHHTYRLYVYREE